MGTNDIYRHPQYPRKGGEVVLKEKPLREFYALRYAIERLRPTSNKDSAGFQSIMTLAGMSGTAVAHAMGDWEVRVYVELMLCAQECAAKGLIFEGFEEHLVGDLCFTILHEDDELEEEEDYE